MVKGDIDLTENMDFYHDSDYKSQKKLPAEIPWKRDIKNKIKISNVDDVYHTMYIPDSYTYSDIVDSLWWTSSPATLTANNVSYNNGPSTLNVSYTVTTNDNTTTYYTYAYTNSSYTSNFGTYWYDSYDIISDTDDGLTIKWYPNKHYGDHVEESTNYPWYNKKRVPKTLSHLTFTSSKDYKERKSDELSIDIIRKLKFAKKREHRGFSLFSPMSARAQILERKSKHSSDFDHKIPWLSKLSSRIREDYLDELRDEGKDYDSYLTNRSWLGLRD